MGLGAEGSELAGKQVAIAATQGRCKLVAYRDPLSNQLAQAWVFGDAVTLLTAPLDKDGG